MEKKNNVCFRYYNEFKFKRNFTVKHCVGSTVVNQKFLDKMIRSSILDHYQVFSFGIGILNIYDNYGNIFSIMPVSGIIDIWNLLTIYVRKESFGGKTLYDAWEFYRITENDNDYQVSIFLTDTTIKLENNNCIAEFKENEFIIGLIKFANQIIEWYDDKYPLFKKSPIRSEILELKRKVIFKYKAILD